LISKILFLLFNPLIKDIDEGATAKYSAKILIKASLALPFFAGAVIKTSN